MKASFLVSLAALAATTANAGEIVELPGLARPPSFKMFGGYVEVRGCVGSFVERRGVRSAERKPSPIPCVS